MPHEFAFLATFWGVWGEGFCSPVGGFHVVEFDDHSDMGTRLVLDAVAADKASPEILKRFGMRTTGLRTLSAPEAA